MDAHTGRRHFVLAHKSVPQATQLARTVGAWLEARGHRAQVLSSTTDVPFEDMDIDAVIALGGDGTMLGVARRMVRRPVPILGINLGAVGFLMEISAGDWQTALERLLRGEYREIRRMALHWKVWRAGRLAREGYAVNDAVASRGAMSRVARFGVSAGGRAIGAVRADGLVIATPMGASGYAVSAGGPLVHPELAALSVTAICPFLCNFPPLVLPLSLPLAVEMLSESVPTFLTLDGQQAVPLETRDVLEVSGEPGLVRYARLGVEGYFARLRTRGFIEGCVHSAPPLHAGGSAPPAEGFTPLME